MAQTCYRHPDRETGVSCSNCDRPICPDCMTTTPVGMRCPECSRDRTRVRRGAGAFASSSIAYAAFALIAINVVAFLFEISSGVGATSGGGGGLIADGGVNGPAIADGEWYRIVTGGFLHAGGLHLAFNMFALYVLGTLLEPAIGTPRFLAIYLAALLGGSAGAILVDPAATTVGASGAIFGLFAATFLIARARGLQDISSQIGFWLVINLALTVSIPQISLGGHIGGLAVGALCGLVIAAGERSRGGSNIAFELITITILATAAFAVALTVA
jgi:membrane associated rhomboid family serine protease